MDLTQENFEKILSENKKLKEENANKEWAFQEERRKKKSYQKEFEQYKLDQNEELETLRNEKKAREEKEAKKKWKYEELLEEKENKIKELTWLNESISVKATKYDELLNSQLELQLAKIPEDKQEFVNKVIDWKDYESKIELLNWFNKEYNPENKDFSNKVKGGEWVDKDTTEFQKAKENWDVSWLIANAPVL